MCPRVLFHTKSPETKFRMKQYLDLHNFIEELRQGLNTLCLKIPHFPILKRLLKFPWKVSNSFLSKAAG